MVRHTAALVAIFALTLSGCGSKKPLTSGTGAVKLKDPVWATYGWSKNRMNYIIYFTPNASIPFSPEGVAATAKFGDGKEGDLFEGVLSSKQSLSAALKSLR